MDNDVMLIEYDGETPPRGEPCGTARIVEKGFDLDVMKRYVVLEVDSPIEFFRGRHRITYGALEQQPDGLVLPAPMGDETERSMIEELAAYHRALLV